MTGNLVLDRLGGPLRLGLGGAPLGNLYAPLDDDTAQHTIGQAWQLGLRYFDTAPLYGHGLSEVRLGRFLQHQPRESFVLSTKVGRLLRADPDAPPERDGYVRGLPFAPRFDYGFDGAMRSFEDSLQRLNLDRIDIAFIHDIDRHTHGDAQPARFREKPWMARTARCTGCAVKACSEPSASASMNGRPAATRWPKAISTASCSRAATRCSTPPPPANWCRCAAFLRKASS